MQGWGRHRVDVIVRGSGVREHQDELDVGLGLVTITATLDSGNDKLEEDIG